MNIETQQLEQRVTDRFVKEYGHDPAAFILAPGRVNLIGEYTDFNNGFVLPMAIDRFIGVAVKKRNDGIVKITSVDFDKQLDFSINMLKKNNHSFQEYITGCVWALQKENYKINGFDCVIAGNIPPGAGLSSSAALEIAIIMAISHISGFSVDRTTMARIGQNAENNWVGVNCGIMDQIISSSGQTGHALLIDCRELTMEPCPLPQDTSVIVLDTHTRRNLMESAYNERKNQCFAAAEVIGVPFLRDCSIETLAEFEPQMERLVYMRARHVITENARVLVAGDALKSGDGKKLGKLMCESHSSLKDDFEVTSPALDSIVSCAQSEQSCFGARMTGAGFGGCGVALVEKKHTETFIENVTACYLKDMGFLPKIYVCAPSEGVKLKEL